jgi:hypothetical protein
MPRHVTEQHGPLVFGERGAASTFQLASGSEGAPVYGRRALHSQYNEN